MSYASFPITDTLEIIQDTVQTEDIKRYHSSLIKMGFDLNTCKCESCRIGIAPLTNNREVNKPLNQFQRIWLANNYHNDHFSNRAVLILLLRWADEFRFIWGYCAWINKSPPNWQGFF